DGFFLLAMGFTGKKAIYFKQKYIEAFNEMEDVIRKNTVPQTIEDMMIYQLEEMKDVKKDVSMLKNTMRISGQQEFEIKQKGNMKVMEVLGGKESRAYEEISKKVFSKFWSEFKRTFSIPRYGELPRKRFDDAVSFIEMWLPETAIRMEIDQLNRQQRLFGDENE
ncbi:TPA: ORF6C domain-containing protein, partial [Enterococcus faecium]